MKKTLVILLLILMVGCSKKYAKDPEVTGSPEGEATEEVAAEGIEEEYVEEIIITREEDKIGETVISPEEEARTVFKDVFFDYDKYNVRPEARPILDNVALFLSRNKSFNVVV